jgi:hypothetical protein
MFHCDRLLPTGAEQMGRQTDLVTRRRRHTASGHRKLRQINKKPRSFVDVQIRNSTPRLPGSAGCKNSIRPAVKTAPIKTRPVTGRSRRRNRPGIYRSLIARADIMAQRMAATGDERRA